MLKSDKGRIKVKCKTPGQLYAELATLVVFIAKRHAVITNEPVDVSMCNILDICWDVLALEEEKEAGGKENGKIFE